MEEKEDLTGAFLLLCCLCGLEATCEGSSWAFQAVLSRGRWCRVIWSTNTLLFNEGSTQEPGTVPGGSVLQGWPDAFAKGMEGGWVAPRWAVLCSAGKTKSIHLSLTIQVMPSARLLQNPLVLITLTLSQLCRSYFRSWFLGLTQVCACTLSLPLVTI